MSAVDQSRGLSWTAGSSRHETIPRPSGASRRRSAIVELGLAEELRAAAVLDRDELAQQHADRLRGHAADALERVLALVRVEVGEQRAQVGEVEQREAVLVGEAEDEREALLLRLVRLEDLREQLRAEVGDGCAHGHARADAAEREELDREARRLVRETQLGHPLWARARRRRPARPARRGRPSRRRRRRAPRLRTAARRSPGSSSSCRFRSPRRRGRGGSSSRAAPARPPPARPRPRERRGRGRSRALDRVGLSRSSHANSAIGGRMIEVRTLTDGGQTALRHRASARRVPRGVAARSLDLALYDIRRRRSRGAARPAALLDAHGARRRGPHRSTTSHHPGPIPVPPPPIRVPDTDRAAPGADAADLRYPRPHAPQVRDPGRRERCSPARPTGPRTRGRGRRTCSPSSARREVAARLPAELRGALDGRLVAVTRRRRPAPDRGRRLATVARMVHAGPRHVARPPDRAQASTGHASAFAICSPVISSGPILGTLAQVATDGRLDVAGVVDATQITQVITQWHDERQRRLEDPAPPARRSRKAASPASARPRGAPGTVHDFMHAKVTVADDTVVRRQLQPLPLGRAERRERARDTERRSWPTAWPPTSTTSAAGTGRSSCPSSPDRYRRRKPVPSGSSSTSTNSCRPVGCALPSTSVTTACMPATPARRPRAP